VAEQKVKTDEARGTVSKKSKDTPEKKNKTSRVRHAQVKHANRDKK
jgi:hypothetical protein